MDILMQVWTVTGLSGAGKDSYWIDCCNYGHLLNCLMQLRAFSGYTGARMYVYCFD